MNFEWKMKEMKKEEWVKAGDEEKVRGMKMMNWEREKGSEEAGKMKVRYGRCRLHVWLIERRRG